MIRAESGSAAGPSPSPIRPRRVTCEDIVVPPSPRFCYLSNLTRQSPATQHRVHADSSFAFCCAKSALRRPRLDDQQRRLLVRRGDDDLGDVGAELIAVSLAARGPGGNRPPGDLGLARPLGLFTLD